MTKFVLVTVGFTPPTSEIMASWKDWFSSIKEYLIEQVGLRNGRKVTPEGIAELPMDPEAITGYVIIEVDSMEKAVEIAQRCPMITSTLVYELM